ncbi:Hpt domain-containing protein [Comamonas kerstersii]
MMSTTRVTAPAAQHSLGEHDLGPLAWVLEEVRKSLDGAIKATRLFVREAEAARDSDLAVLDSSPLRMAKQHLHQSCGALEMVGMPQAALLLRSMEAAVQHYVQKPANCTEAVVQTLEKASFALLEFLETVLAGKRITAVALFPQYRDVQALFDAQGKVHPADLWPIERRLRDPELGVQCAPLAYDAQQRKILDAAVLQIVRGDDIAQSSMRVRDVCLGYAQAQTEAPMRIFWKVAAAYFDAMAHGLLKVDIYSKRVASRVLMVSVALAKGDPVAPERLLQDMLFFCAQARTSAAGAQDATVWKTVYDAFGLQRHTPVDYEQVRFGRFEPTALAQARKRIAAAAEIWSALAGGNVQKIKPAVDQFSLVCDSLQKLMPGGQGLAKALTQVLSSVATRNQPPSPEVGMEVATAVLYLQAALTSLDISDEDMSAHAATLAQRLTSVLAGAASQPLEPWMEQLYRQVSDQQTMGSVVGELRGTLAETEKLLDRYFRSPDDKSMLSAVATHLSQMRGVLSVLGLEPASQAMVCMRQYVERLQTEDMPEDEQRTLFDKIGNSLGALGFLIDMLGYQRNIARKLYEFDEQDGELKLLMGRVRLRAGDETVAKPVEEVLQARVQQIDQPIILKQPAAPAVQEVQAAEAAAESAPVPAAEPASAPQPAAPALSIEPVVQADAASAAPLEVAHEDSDDELLDIFLEEAREVVGNGRAALELLAEDPANMSEQTVLRRAFHTLKGSSRMVGLDEFGQAGWAMEQMLNAWLAEQKAMPAPMRQLAAQALDGFEAWVAAIEAGAAQSWQSAPFRASADAMRLEGRLIALDIHAASGQQAAAPSVVLEVADDAQVDALSVAALEDVAEAAPAVHEEASESALQLDISELLLQDEAAAPALEPQSTQEAAADIPVAEEISFDEFDALLKASEDGPQSSAEPASVQPQEPEAAEVPQVLELPELEALQLQTDAAETMQAMPAEQEMEPEAEAVPVAQQEQEAPATPAVEIKQIGDVAVSLPLFNVYLGEAEEWSARLLAALTGWQSELHEAQPDMVNAWAHSLAGSSATVGFAALSGLARKLEHALQHVAPQPHGVAEQVQVFVSAAEEIRSMLHQFAAGVLPTASEQLHAQLQHILDSALLSQAPAQVQADVEAAATPTVAEQLATAPEPEPVVPAMEQQPVVHAVALDDDEIEAVDAIDPDLFPIFEEEAMELLPTIGAAMREWSAHPARTEARHTLLRALHTFKGSSRLAGAMRLGEMAHRLESAVEALDAETASAERIDPLFARLDAMEAGFRALCAQGEAGGAEQLKQPVPVEVEEASPPATAQPQYTAWTDATPAGAAAPAVQDAARAASQQTVRVRSQLLDRLINEAGEVLIARSRLDVRMHSIKHSLQDLSVNLDKLRQQLRDVEVQAESQMQSRMQLAKEAGADFDPLEFDRFTRVQELTRMMAESVNDVATVQRSLQRDVDAAEDDLIAQGRQSRELQRDLLRTRMVEFDAISERLYAVVRRTSKETGKQVKLGLTGGTIEMDRGVLERMVPAFEHLLRNCVDHGIEKPELRTAAGKPASGTISVQVQQEGNDVAVSFHDDGAGLNVERIRDKALAQGLITADEVVDAARAAQLIFMPGFTTAQQVTGVSGRGIGMDVVRSEVQALGGRIETHTLPGQGSAFRLVLPLTTAVTQVVMLRAGSFSVGVPASLVEVVRRVSMADLEAAYRSGELMEGDERIPFYWAGAVWSQSPRSVDDGAGKTRPVVLIRSASQRIALHVDEVLGQQEVVIKPLGAQMSRLPGLTGMSVLASGAVVLIYNPVALTTVYGAQIRELGKGLPAVLDEQTAKQLQREAAPAEPVTGVQPSSQVPLVMVVDDSITVRRVSQRLLQREGYRVITANDGLQALDKLQGEELPSVVLSDIEMPRMDGFDLLRSIRAAERLQHLPVIMITSRIAQKHRDHAMELGANHYLGKPYSDDELMALVHHYAVGKPLPEPQEDAVAVRSE